MKKDKFLDTKIRDISWTYGEDSILIFYLGLSTLREAYNLTDKILELKDINANAIMHICDTLKSLNEKVFYESKLYNTLKTGERFQDVAEHLKDEKTIAV